MQPEAIKTTTVQGDEIDTKSLGIYLPFFRLGMFQISEKFRTIFFAPPHDCNVRDEI